MDAALATTPLHDWHRDHGGRLVDFAGWSMPVQYTSISDEHLATRQRATLFDVSHMGRFRFHGAGAGDWLNRLLTRRVDDLPAGRIRYSLITGDDGGILDDVLVYHLLESSDRPSTGSTYWLVVNASNRPKIWNWLGSHPCPTGAVEVTDRTVETAMIAVQGPLARNLVQTVFGLDELATLKNYAGRLRRVEGNDWIVSRTGYTGEDGAELIVPASVARSVWERLLAAGQPQGVRAAGLGARDTLRLEAAMPLYGHELTEQITPWQAGLAFAVDLADRSFPGRDALAEMRAQALPCRVGLRLEGKRVGRQHAAVFLEDGPAIGEVTSGTFSPTFQQSLAMAYVPPEAAAPGTEVGVDVRGRREAAHVVPLPFYQRR